MPCTGMARLAHSTLLPRGAAEVQLKAGSLQRFVPHDCTSEDVGSSLFDTEQVRAGLRPWGSFWCYYANATLSRSSFIIWRRGHVSVRLGPPPARKRVHLGCERVSVLAEASCWTRPA